MKRISLYSGLILILVMQTWQAEARRDNRREGRQQARISQGVKSGELTQKEAAGLRHEQRHIDRAQIRAQKDGVVTPEEKARMEKMQDRANKHIYNQKHDAQKRE